MSKTVYTLLVEEVADAHFKRIGDPMQPADGDVTPTVDPVDRLPTNAEQAGQTSVTHVFFIITRRRFSCDSYFSFLIVI